MTNCSQAKDHETDDYSSHIYMQNDRQKQTNKKRK